MRLPVRTALVLAALAAGLRPAQAPAPAGIFRVADVKPGMEVTAYTVFAGTTVEPFHGRVLGIAKNLMGPARDIVLVDFYEDRLRHTGIVHGMSGSPVYIGDRVLGALSLSLSPLPKDAIAGVTPLEYMLAEADREPGGPPPPRRADGRRLPARRCPGRIPRDTCSSRSARRWSSPASGPRSSQRFRADFAALGLEPMLAAGGTDPTLALGPDDLQPGARGLGGPRRRRPLARRHRHHHLARRRPLFAFGHPFLLQGRVESPDGPGRGRHHARRPDLPLQGGELGQACRHGPLRPA